MPKHHRYEHPFILSDNRHYSFYVWKKIYRRHWTVRYALTPVYILSSVLNLQVFGKYSSCSNKHITNGGFLAQYNSVLLTIGYLFVLLLTLVPSPLLEFRYFIIPFLFYMIHIPPPTQTVRTLISLGVYFAIHIATIYLFIYKPFIWQNEPNQLQRFMW